VVELCIELFGGKIPRRRELTMIADRMGLNTKQINYALSKPHIRKQLKI
jgi:hypothetical protein